MSVTRWDPFQDLHSVREEMNRALNRWFGREDQGDERSGPRWAPALDVTETDDAYRIDVEVPGLKPEDIEVTLDQGMLTVKGERRSEEEHRDRQVHRIERRYGAFRRSITLPTNVDPDRVEATYDNGVLRLTVPKTEAAQPKRIAIQSQSGTTAGDQSQRVAVTGEPSGAAAGQAEGERSS